MDLYTAYDRAATEGALVWHYTSLDTLTRILDNNYLLATEVAFQNDIRETVTADSAFKAALDVLASDDGFSTFAHSAHRLLEDLDSGAHLAGSTEAALTEKSRFIVCTSVDSDSLYAWRTYAGGNSIGCAIGLDPAVPLGVVDPDPPRWGYRLTSWTPVIYERDTITQVAVAELARLGTEWNRQSDGTEDGSSYAFGLLVSHLDTVRSQIRALAKDPSFSDEREQRLTVEGIRRRTPLTFTPSTMGPRPHVRLAVAERWGQSINTATTAPRLPIRAVKLGPDAPQIAETSLQWLLMGHGYSLDALHISQGASTWEESVLILRSAHPYRSR